MNSFWRSCLSHFEQQLPPQQFKTWIKPLKFQATDNQVTLTAPNRFVLQWIRDRFLAEIERLASERFGATVAISLVLAEKETALPPKALVPVSGASEVLGGNFLSRITYVGPGPDLIWDNTDDTIGEASTFFGF